ncbi:tyrosine-protein phosphatase 10D [Galendromus occidentalis]|uniref:protein-tyrosine-phosphatase n=1 Tax=Galendromus occidentalis TaxID=34638 RepID=A0AAJ7WIM1_9ACAR|nr:tyrosine-protein phosphatase 10D [Galendromus occidentalis]
MPKEGKDASLPWCQSLSLLFGLLLLYSCFAISAGQQQQTSAAVSPLTPHGIPAPQSLTLKLPERFYTELNTEEVRIDYKPNVGQPRANFTIGVNEAITGYTIQNVLPGSEYTFSFFDGTILIYNETQDSEPEVPFNLSVVQTESDKAATIYYDPPANGGHTGFRLTTAPECSTDEGGVRTQHLPAVTAASPESPGKSERMTTVRDLTPGCTYEAQLYSVFKEKESSQFLSFNFTTKPNAPGRFIVWFRNETTLLVLWQPPYPSGVFDKYKVSIYPQDSPQSVLFVEKDNDPPGPAQAAFYGLVPGRAYNISVQTLSRDVVSQPTDAQYRTVPLPPTNVTFDLNKVTTRSFDVSWSPPKSFSEFDRYQVALSARHSLRQVVGKDEERRARFDEDIKAGESYEVLVKTVSGNVVSWSVTGNITTRPLPVAAINATAKESGEIYLEWSPARNSTQDSFKVRYNELENYQSDNVQTVTNTSFLLHDLFRGRNYSLSVTAVSKGMESEPFTVYQATRPSPPVIESLEPLSGPGGFLNISWKSDVTSRQDSFVVVYTRNDTQEQRQETTKQNWLVLKNLYPGAGYNIKVSAISHGLWSEPHSYFHTVVPRPPNNLLVTKASNTSMILTWISPVNSIVDHYNVLIRASSSDTWKDLGFVNTTTFEMNDLIAGEKYSVKVNAVSNKAESQNSPVIEQTMYPNAITDVKHSVDSKNVTFSWQRPSGRIDYYIVVFNPVRDPLAHNSHQFPANQTLAGEPVSVTIENLKPGELYSFRLYSVSHSLRSEGVGVETRTMPVIDSVINIVIDEHATKTLGIKYTPTPIRSVVFDRYRFQLLSSTGDFPVPPAQEKLSNDTNRLVVFDNLIPGHLYNISIWTVSGGVSSIPIYRHTRLYPDPVRSIRALTVTDTEISLTWEHSGDAIPGSGDRDGYEVQYLDHQGYLVHNFTLIESMTYVNLKPHHNYTFVVVVVSGYETSTVRRSLPMSQTFQTLESVPGKVHYFRPIDLRPSQITLEWSLPSSEQNGVLTGYKISYYLKGSANSEHKYNIFAPNITNGTIGNLVPGKTYVFEIQAHTKIGPGGKAHSEEIMPIWAPPKPSDSVYPTLVSHTSTSIRVLFRKNYFQNTNGPILTYTLIVAEDDSLTPSQNPMPSWNDVQGFTYWPPYQVMEPYYPFNGTITTEDFIIGTEDCTDKTRQRTSVYCNGPLKPGSQYRIKLRAFTGPDKYTDTTWSYAIQTDPDNSSLIAGIFIPLTVLVCITLILLVLRKRKMGPFNPKPPLKDDPATHSVFYRHDHGMSLPENPVEITRPVKLSLFAEHYRLLSADSDFRFSEEFEMLKHVGRDRPCSAADLPVNRPKNRFTNILPYDHSRVKLLPTDDEEGSDYINANYIPGYNSPREFIVTQGPLHSTRDDFWRMVWEQNCRAIVMLTRCVEKGREKCDHYWPFDMQPVYYGDIQVTILTESQYPDWTISEFKVSRGDQSRIVRHFHFTTWPDFGVPDPPQTLVRFVRTFRERVIPDNKPIVVHCSAGVGRSGTFIALDRILQSTRKLDFVDIFGIVYEMRKDRVWMVQNEQQYICIYQCLMCVLEGTEELRLLHEREIHDNSAFEVAKLKDDSDSDETKSTVLIVDPGWVEWMQTLIVVESLPQRLEAILYPPWKPQIRPEFPSIRPERTF